MNRMRMTPHAMSGVFVFLLLGIFAVFSTLMVVFGVKAYRSAAERSGVNSRSRIASSYLRSMLRGDDAEGALRLETVDGVETVTLLNSYDGEEYVTRLYVYDGYLREWFTEASEPFEPENGEPVCEADAMSAELEGNLLTVSIETDGTWSTACCALRAAVS